MFAALQEPVLILSVSPYLEEFPLNRQNKVLVVDDSAPLHQIYKIILMRYKFLVLSALSGQEGLNKLAEHPDVDLLIVDLAMPRMSGLEFIRKVREQEGFSNVPIIAVTSGETDAGEARSFAQGTLQKPFTSNEMHALIEKLVSISIA